MRLGKWSKVDGKFVHAIDVDIRTEDDEDAALDALEGMFGKRIWGFPRVKSGSGGPSIHIYLTTDEPFVSKKLANSGRQIFDDAGKKHWTWEIEFYGTGKQVAAPPSIHPDSGLTYEWEKPLTSEALTRAFIASDELADIVFPAEELTEVNADILGISYDDAERAVKALDLADWCEDREGWRNLGMALHHEFGGSEEAFDIWTAFSKKSRKFDKRVQRQQWRSFKDSKERPIRMATVLKASNDYVAEMRRADVDALLNDEPEAEEEKEVEAEGERLSLTEPAAATRSYVPKLTIEDIPKHLLTVPGKLGLAVDHYNATALRAQPQFAVQAALAVGSVVLGRNWVTDQGNFTSLYFLCLAETSAGKEHVKTTIEKCLRAADLDAFIGPKTYTSEAGVISAMLYKPRHISIADEFGKYLASSRASGNSHKSDVQSSLMELFGRLHSVYQGIGYSTHGMTAEQAKMVNERKVERPAVTIMGTTTQTTLFGALSFEDVRSGFLNRFLIVNSPLGRDVMRRVKQREVPGDLVKWMKNHAWKTSDEDEQLQAAIDPTYTPTPIEVPFTNRAWDKLDDFAYEVVDLQNKFAAIEMAELFGRSREIAMRLSLIVAKSCESDRIEGEHVAWAIDYVRFYTEQIVDEFLNNIGLSETEDVANAVYAIILDAGAKGISERDISRRCRQFRRFDRKLRDEVLSRLRTDFGVVVAKATGRNGGRPKEVLICGKFLRK